MTHNVAARPQKPAGGREIVATGHDRKSEAVRERAILALLTTNSFEGAADRCGLHERTLRRWLREDDAFKVEYDKARTAMYRQGLDRVQGMTGHAVDTLVDLLNAKKNPAVRLGAARTILEMGMHEYDADVILKKLEAIEAAQNGGTRDARPVPIWSGAAGSASKP